MVGDSAIDILAGKAAGVFTCGFTGGFRSKEELEAAGAYYLIGDIDELVGLVADTGRDLPESGFTRPSSACSEGGG